MKNKIILLTLIFATIVSLQYSSGPASVNGQGYTGAPGESGTLCSNCHTGGAYGTPSATLAITDAMGTTVTSYTAGDTYQISLTAVPVSGTPGGYGFQLTVLDVNDGDVANFTNPSTNAKISIASAVAGGRTYAEHNSASVSSTFTFDWEAPIGGTGDLTFYYNVNLVDATGGTNNDNGGAGFSSSMNESIAATVKVIGALEINNAFTLPMVDGTVNQVLTTDGAGTVSWMDAPTAFTGDSSSDDNLRKSDNQNTDYGLQAVEINNLKNDIILLKSEIEALKKLINKLTEE